MPDPIDRVLAAYGRDYRPDDGPSLTDRGIRASDRYLAEHDPLRAVAISADGRASDVRLGVDPGTFYCGDQLANLNALAAAAPFAGRTRTGFIHLPPDRDTGPAAAESPALHGRATNLEHAARVLAVALRSILGGPGDRALVLTGFGPFQGVAHNPTAALVGDPAAIDRCVALAFPGARRLGSAALHDPRGDSAGERHVFVAPDARRLSLLCAELPLAPTREAALAGRYVSTRATEANFLRILAAMCDALAGPPAGLISLGVDSSQVGGRARPVFKVETRTRGWHRGDERGRTASEEFRPSHDLARIFLEARRAGDDLLTFLPE